MSTKEAALIHDCSLMTKAILAGEANHIDLYQFIRRKELERVREL